MYCRTISTISLEIGIKPTFREYNGKDPLKFVLSLNLARRHLNSSQLAFIALEAERILSEEAKARQVEAGKERTEKAERDENGRMTQLVEFFPQASNEPKQTPKEPKSRDKAAELVGGTNARYVQEAKKIARDAPEVRELVMSGKMNMSDAVKVVNLTN